MGLTSCCEIRVLSFRFELRFCRKNYININNLGLTVNTLFLTGQKGSIDRKKYSDIIFWEVN